MKKIIILFLIVLSCCHLYATRTETQMKEAAWNAVKLLTNKSDNVSELKELLSREKLKVYGYEDGGFAVISSDDSFETVIGVSSGIFDDSLPCGFKWWIETVNSNMGNGSPENFLRSRDYIVKKTPQGVSTLLSTLWGQERPYNDNCYFTNGNSRYQCVTGCVATALAQVMNYHRFPLCGSGSISYNITYNNAFTITFAEDFEQSIYDWGNMLDDYSAYYYSSTVDAHTQAVAKLMKDCGIATRTRYSDSSHGSSSSAYNAITALKTYFKYDNSTTLYNRSDFSKEEWMNLVFEELDNGRPIFYTGNEGDGITSVGHAFVLSGYDAEGKVYVNWGWDGNYNGYYDIDLLNPGNNQFNYNQSMIVAVPGTDDTVLHTLTISSNGFGSVSYGNVNETQVRNSTQTFKVKEGNNAVIYFNPDMGFDIKRIKLNGTDITSNISANQYVINNIHADATLEVEFDNESSYTASEYNKYLVCRGISVSTVGMGSYVRAVFTFEVSNSGNSDIIINKLVGKDPDTNEILFSLTDSYINGLLQGNTSKTHSVEFNHEIATNPVFEVEYNWDNQNYYYFSSQNYILTLQANDYGFINFGNISVGSTAKRFSIEPGGQALVGFEPKTDCVLRKVLVNNSEVTADISNNQYIISDIISNRTVKAIFDSNSENCTTIDGYEYVDLGLSSGKCWSSKNYGANIPEDNGTYHSNSRDVVTIDWGDNWRMPTEEDFRELIDECDWSWVTLNGTNGFEIKGPNGKTIFLPAAGYEELFDSYKEVGSTAYYLTSTKRNYSYACILKATSSSLQMIYTWMSTSYYPIRPISNVTKAPQSYKLTYMLDDEVYKSYEIKAGETITPEPNPTKEGYTFGGWSDIPAKMPAHDVTIVGSFIINKYKLIYIIDGEEYKTYDIEYGATIIPEEEPVKDGYLFSGWSEIPLTMPAHNVTIEGTFERHFNVGHIVKLLNCIMWGNASPDDLGLYDLNNDGWLNIGDVVLVVRNILNYGGSVSLINSTRTDTNVDFSQYSAVQFELKTGNNPVRNIRLIENMEQSHRLMYKRKSEGVYVVVIYSQSNDLLKPDDNNIIIVETDGNAKEEMIIQNIAAATPLGDMTCYQGLQVAAGIHLTRTEIQQDVSYDLKGLRINASKKGIHIINSKKTFVK